MCANKGEENPDDCYDMFSDGLQAENECVGDCDKFMVEYTKKNWSWWPSNKKEWDEMDQYMQGVGDQDFWDDFSGYIRTNYE